jgi:hypothetical protein
MAALEEARAHAKEGKTREAAEASERALRLATDHPERAELARYLVAAARVTDASLTAEERESLLLRAGWAGGAELEAELQGELRAAHADVLAHRGVVDRTLTGAASKEPPKAPERGRRGLFTGALVALALTLAAAGEHQRRKSVSRSPS